jgi:hypothetical protein
LIGYLKEGKELGIKLNIILLQNLWKPHHLRERRNCQCLWKPDPAEISGKFPVL